MALNKKAPSKVVDDAGFQQTVDQIKEQDMAKPNDIPVDEDGIIRNEPLLAGYRDENGITHSTFDYREMDGSDEEEINKPDIRSNAGKVLTTICERCVLKIGTISKKDVDRKTWSNIIRSMYVYELQYIVFKIRELSKGKVINFKYDCPHCKGKIVAEMDTDEFEIIPFNGQHEISFSLRRGVKDRHGNYHKDGHLRIMNGFDAEIVLPQYRKNEAVAKTLLMSRLMRMDDDGEGFMLDNNMVKYMTIHDRDTIEKEIQDSVYGVSTSTEMECPNCGETVNVSAGVSDFI